MCFHSRVGAQQTQKYFKQYLEETGALQEINFHLFQDSRGFIWISGVGGITRFDSDNFRNNASTTRGLASVGNMKAIEDQHGRIWFVGLNGQITVLRNGRFYPYAFNKKIDKYLSWDRCTSFHVDKDGTLHLGTFMSGYLQVTREGNLTIKYSEANNKPGIYLSYIEGTPFVFSVRRRKEDTVFPVFKILENGSSVKLGEISDFGTSASANKTRFIERKDRSICITAYDKLLTINESELTIDTAPFPINFLMEDRFENLWYSNSVSKGIWCAQKGEMDYQKHQQFLPDASINYMLEDTKGGYWFATRDNGIYYSPSFWDFEFSEFADAIPVDADSGFKFDLQNTSFTQGGKPHKNRVYARTANRKTYYLTLPGASTNIHKIIKDSIRNRLLIGCKLKLFSYDQQGFKELVFGETLLNTVRSISLLPDSSYCISSGQFIHFIKNDSVINSSPPCPFEIMDICPTDSVIFVGTLGGLFKLKNNEWHDLRSVGERGNGLIRHITKFNGCIWIFNRGDGVAYLNKQGQLTNVDDAECSVMMGAIKSIVKQDKLHFMAAGGRYFIISPKTKGAGYNLRLIPSPNLLRDDFVFGIGLAGDQIVFSSATASYFVSSTILSNPKMNMVFDQIRINKKPFHPKSHFILPHDSNAIEIGFVAHTYHSNGPYHYKYYMSGIEPYTKTTDNTVRFTTLPPGEYKFNVYAINDYSERSNHQSVNFTILPPFYLTWWFIVLECLFGLLLVGTLAKIRINQVKRRSRLLEELHTSQHQALSARLNPHFIFNSLSSIYHFTLKNDKEKAAEYMSEYAHLMRLVLENSGQNLIALQSEIEAITIYLELEKLRCQGKFEYSIQIPDSSKNLNPPIPSLMLQPYLENAIWHGLMPMDSDNGTLTIGVNSEAGKTIIEIEDNGIGRMKAQALKTTNHEGFQSVGTDINLRRIELLNKLYKVDFNVNILDLKQGDIGIGTKVIINVPTI